MAAEESISDKEKIRIASDFLLHAPPGEFNEVFNDVRLLINNDTLLKEGCAFAFSQYDKDQFIPVRIEGVDKPTLITVHNELDDNQGRFYDPKSGKSFKYDHLRNEAFDVQQYENGDSKSESWRKALQQAADVYIENHYQKSGVCVVFGTVDQASGRIGIKMDFPPPFGIIFSGLSLCIEAHQFQSRNFWNGRWRSQWAVLLTEKQAELKATIKVQVHYYEDGNVQLVSSKDIVHKINVTTEPESTAKEIIRIIEEEESAYQTAVQENYLAMSDTTFKALRRQLPITRTKLDWMKIHSYRVAHDMKPQ